MKLTDQVAPWAGVESLRRSRRCWWRDASYPPVVRSEALARVEIRLGPHRTDHGFHSLSLHNNRKGLCLPSSVPPFA